MEDKIAIPFTRQANGYKYSDTIYLNKDHTFTEAEIKQMQDLRFSTWMTLIDAASKENTVAEAPVEEVPVEENPEVTNPGV